MTSTTAAATTYGSSRAYAAHAPDVPIRLVDRLRAEFTEMPGLRLTLRQAARVFGVEPPQAKRLLKALLDEGFLVCDARGTFRRRQAPAETAAARARLTGPPPVRPFAGEAAAGDRRPWAEDLLEAIGVELPCLSCQGTYRISLRKVLSSQTAMADGCQVRHFSDCPPGAFAHLIDRDVLAEFETAVQRIETAAEKAGGRLVGPD